MTAPLQRGDPFDGADVQRLWHRVLSRVEVTPCGCWRWTGGVTSQGYGAISTGAGTGQVHRLAVIVRDGAIAEGMQVDHACHDSRCQARPCPHRRCVNPDHLAQVTPGANVRRQNEHARCQYGHPLTTRADGTRRRCLTCAQTYEANRKGGRSPASLRVAAEPGPHDVPLFDWPPS